MNKDIATPLDYLMDYLICPFMDDEEEFSKAKEKLNPVVWEEYAIFPKMNLYLRLVRARDVRISLRKPTLPMDDGCVALGDYISLVDSYYKDEEVYGPRDATFDLHMVCWMKGEPVSRARQDSVMINRSRFHRIKRIINIRLSHLMESVWIDSLPPSQGNAIKMKLEQKRTYFKGDSKRQHPPMTTSGSVYAQKALDACREQGLKMLLPRHPLVMLDNSPDVDPPMKHMAMLKKDWQLRSALILGFRTDRTLDWNGLMEKAYKFQHKVNSLIKPFKRMLCQRKITFTVANIIADEYGYPWMSDKHMNLCIKEQQILLNTAPRWAYKSRDRMFAYLRLQDAIRVIRRSGRKPSSSLTNITEKDFQRVIGEMKNPEEVPQFLVRFIEAGGTAPTSVRGLDQFMIACHDYSSAVHQLLYGRRKDSCYVLSKPLPELPNIGKTRIREFKTPEDYSAEGREMQHCIGLYAGDRGFFARVERDVVGENGQPAVEAVSLMVKRDSHQCYGKLNKPNDLSRDVISDWVPVIQKALAADPDALTLVETGEPEKVELVFD